MISKNICQSDLPGDFNLQFSTKIIVYGAKKKGSVWFYLMNLDALAYLAAKKVYFVLFCFSLFLLEFLKINFKHFKNHLKDDNNKRIKGGGTIVEWNKH